MFRKLLLIISVIVPMGLQGQDTVFNALDKNGLKTGWWKSYYDNGRLRYIGYFFKGDPSGEMRRYYPGGIIQAQMNFAPGNISRVKLYDEKGKLTAEGKYIGKAKDSTWNYYSPYDGIRIMTENYKFGKKDGKTIKYFPNGKVSEIREWKDDVLAGTWLQFYDNGDARLKGSHENGKREGGFSSYYPGKILSITGSYKNGEMDGTWTYFTEKGEAEMTVEYREGKMLPNPEYDKRVSEFSKKIEEVVGKFPEPSGMK